MEHQAFFKLRQCLWCVDAHEAICDPTQRNIHFDIFISPLCLTAVTIFFSFKYMNGWFKTEKCPFNPTKLLQTADHTLTFCSGLVASLITNYNMKTKWVPMPSTGKSTALFSVKVRRNHTMQGFGFGEGGVNVLLCFLDEREHQWYITYQCHSNGCMFTLAYMVIWADELSFKIVVFFVLFLYTCYFLPRWKTSHILGAAGADWMDFLRDSFDLEIEGQRKDDSETKEML